MTIRTFGMAAALCCSGLVAGCSADPASQEPVKLQPGLYSVTMAGARPGFLMQKTAGEELPKVCIDKSESESKTYAQRFPAEYFTTMGASCNATDSDRTGNQISGEISCKLFDGARGALILTWAGEVEEQALEARASMTLKMPSAQMPNDIDPGALEGLEIQLRADRTGDCPVF